MSDFKHTPEPWVSVDHVDGFNALIQGQGQHIAECWSLNDRRSSSANASRIVECVNALEGVENPTEWRKIQIERIKENVELKQQRDELLAALEAIIILPGFEPNEPYALAALEAISKAKEVSNG